ncbi:MAG: RES family NAD+ phosphorylase [Rhodobacteraceae bacterium]|nr:RES family NAD+ phosphorylase [Paracoccaceae bacterium]
MDAQIYPSDTSLFVRIEGTFYRSISKEFVQHVLDGSTRPGRYSTQDQKALYVSPTPQGVAAAMQAHSQPDSPKPVLVQLDISADNIFDLRDQMACDAAGITRDDAFAPWQEIVAQGGRAKSWIVADQLRQLGASGVIDPSRASPGLWHLVLFHWNMTDQPTVSVQT